ncbi:hypothetical protein PMIN04_002658 [Paraphaeosphaeria minitans]
MNVYPVYHACFDLSGAGAAALLHAGWTRSTFTPSPVSLTRREEESATIISRANPPGGVDELQPSPPLPAEHAPSLLAPSDAHSRLQLCLCGSV